MTSPSTLIRQAKQTPNPARAKKLRAQAAKLRREIRAAAKKKAKTKKAKVDHPVKQAGPITGAGMTAFYDKDAGCIVLSDDVAKLQRNNRLRDMAKNTKSDMFDAEIQRLADDATYKARQEAEAAHTNALRTIYEINSINVVSAFLAEIEGVNALNKGSLPPSVMVSGFTLARIVAALRNAGYTTEGKGSVNRLSLTRR
jgi:hypothetical protein